MSRLDEGEMGAYETRVFCGRVALFGVALYGGLAVTGAAQVALAHPDRAPLFAASALVALALAVWAARGVGLARASVLVSATAIPSAWLAFRFLTGDLLWRSSTASCTAPSGDWQDVWHIPEAAVASLIFAACFALLARLAEGFLRLASLTRHALARTIGLVALLGAAGIVSLALRKGAAHPDPNGARASVQNVGCFNRDTETGQTVRLGNGDPLRRRTDVHIDADGLEDPAHQKCTARIDDVEDGAGALAYVQPCSGAGCCRTICLRHWAAAHLWIADTYDRVRSGPISPQGFVAPAFRSQDTSFASLAGHLAPPLSWVLSSILGIVVAIAPLLMRARRADTDWLGLGQWNGTDRDDLSDPLLAVQTGRWLWAAATILVTGAPLFAACVLGFVI